MNKIFSRFLFIQNILASFSLLFNSLSRFNRISTSKLRMSSFDDNFAADTDVLVVGAG